MSKAPPDTATAGAGITRVVIYIGGQSPDPASQRRRCHAFVQRQGYELVAIAEDAPGQRQGWRDVRRMRKAGQVDAVVVVGVHVIPMPAWLHVASGYDMARRTRRLR